MRVFETIHLLLIAGLVFGVPVAGATRPIGQEFSWSSALAQAGVVALILVVLLSLNFVAARLALRRASRR
jgi:hypothetical protein